MTGSITLSDNGNLADDAFELAIDGVVFGDTQIGQPNTIAVNNLIPGNHTIKVTTIISPDDVGTLPIALSDGWTFSDGTTTKSTTMGEGDSVVYVFVVPASN